MKISTERQSILAIMAGLLVTAWISNNYFWLVAAAAVALILPFPILYKPVHKYWMLLATVLGWISRHIILFILFYFFLTPLSLLMKLFGKKVMRTHLKKESSTFVTRHHTYVSKDLDNPW